MTYTQVSRDPFARADLMRATVPASLRTPCVWCGSRPGRFVYWWEPDGLRAPARPRMDTPAGRRGVCCKGCHVAYRGGAS